MRERDVDNLRRISDFEICTTVTTSRYIEFGEIIETARRVEHNISKGRKVQILKQKHGQS